MLRPITQRVDARRRWLSSTIQGRSAGQHNACRCAQPITWIRSRDEHTRTHTHTHHSNRPTLEKAEITWIAIKRKVALPPSAPNIRRNEERERGEDREGENDKQMRPMIRLMRRRERERETREDRVELKSYEVEGRSGEESVRIHTVT